MITLFRLLAILCLFYNVSVYAVNCYQDQRGGNTQIRGNFTFLQNSRKPSRDKKFGKAMTLMLRYIVITRQDGELMIPQKIFMPGLKCRL
ncbi:hypothetical protein DMH88_07375 [Escherichia coli]|nr:hypothetical protein [Escherichia coli]